MAEASINARDVMSTLTLRIHGIGLATLRMRLAAYIFRFGGWVAGTNLEIDTSGSRLELLPEAERRIDRRAGCVYVSTHEEISPDGTSARKWDRVNLPD
jgi:hypothetical protein